MDRLRALSVVLATLSLLAVGPPPASSAESSREDVELDEVLITGERPGPAMWKVTKGDHTLWIMGTLSPMPAKMSWRQKRAEDVIQASGEILAASTSDWDMDLGFREAVGMIRTLLKLRHNADGSTLREVLPDDVYERWHAAHRRWFGEKPSPKERARPLYAALLLYSRSLKKSGLTEEPLVWERAEKLAKQHKVKIRQRRFRVKVEDPKGMFAELANLPRDQEVACLVEVMDFIDREVPQMKRRAEAWALGDLAALRALPPAALEPQCVGLGEGTRIDQLDKAEEALFAKDWAGIVDWMLLTHETSFTTFPVSKLFAEDGVLAQLRAKGYTVEEPM
ncbi:MAG TPA: TraB/GumN family protein [Steroidobacteraceae bacterium]|nr:TraB/GumN family protein [Steroidobacteraceae bacterium]